MPESPATRTDTLVLTVPDRKTPGFPRRLKQIMQLQRVFRSLTSEEADPAAMDTVIEGLLPYVSEPLDRDEAREALWQCSQEQFEEVLRALSGAPLSETATGAG